MNTIFSLTHFRSCVSEPRLIFREPENQSKRPQRSVKERLGSWLNLGKVIEGKTGDVTNIPAVAETSKSISNGAKAIIDTPQKNEAPANDEPSGDAPQTQASIRPLSDLEKEQIKLLKFSQQKNSEFRDRYKVPGGPRISFEFFFIPDEMFFEKLHQALQAVLSEELQMKGTDVYITLEYSGSQIISRGGDMEASILIVMNDSNKDKHPIFKKQLQQKCEEIFKDNPFPVRVL